jgi:signal transduction histidine kinase
MPMPIFHNLSIPWKLLWVGMLSSGTALLLVCTAFVIYDRLTFRDMMVRQLVGQAEVIGRNSTSALLFDDPSAASTTLAALRAEPRVVSAAIYAADGQKFAIYVREVATAAAMLPEQHVMQANGHHFGDRHLVLFRRIMASGGPVGTVYLQADLHEIEQRLKRYLAITGGVGLASFFLALLSSSWLQRRISHPILQLVHAARIVSSEKNYAIRAVSNSRDELGLLVTAFNEMLAQIQQGHRELQKARDELEERVVERTAQLEAANKELEAFSYSVSHDLRAPLRAAAGFSYILLEEHGAFLVPEAQRYLRLICDNVQQMGQLIDDLLTFSRLSRQPLSKQPVALADLTRQVLNELEPMPGEGCIEVAIGDLPTCQADPALLKRVLVNLLTNAIKFSSKREVPRIAVDCQHEGGTQVYFVKDNGVGFDMRYVDQLFGVFQRLHRSEEYDGTGVGLAIVQRIIHRHGGRIWAEAAVDHGATFYFTLEGDAPHDGKCDRDPAC